MDRTAIIEPVLERAASYPAGKAGDWYDSNPAEYLGGITDEWIMKHG